MKDMFLLRQIFGIMEVLKSVTQKATVISMLKKRGKMNLNQ